MEYAFVHILLSLLALYLFRIPKVGRVGVGGEANAWTWKGVTLSWREVQILSLRNLHYQAVLGNQLKGDERGEALIQTFVLVT